MRTLSFLPPLPPSPLLPFPLKKEKKKGGKQLIQQPNKSALITVRKLINCLSVEQSLFFFSVLFPYKKEKRKENKKKTKINERKRRLLKSSMALWGCADLSSFLLFFCCPFNLFPYDYALVSKEMDSYCLH